MSPYLTCFILVALIGVAQLVFQMSPESIQAFSIPVVFVFQRYVLSRPISQIWSRTDAAISIRCMVGVSSMSVCLAGLSFFYLGDHSLWPVLGFAVLGSVPLSFAMGSM